jgi:hypothetical protein
VTTKDTASEQQVQMARDCARRERYGEEMTAYKGMVFRDL